VAAKVWLGKLWLGTKQAHVSLVYGKQSSFHSDTSDRSSPTFSPLPVYQHGSITTATLCARPSVPATGVDEQGVNLSPPIRSNASRCQCKILESVPFSPVSIWVTTFLDSCAHLMISSSVASQFLDSCKFALINSCKPSQLSAAVKSSDPLTLLNIFMPIHFRAHAGVQGPPRNQMFLKARSFRSSATRGR
jgi:hypothetical protein